MFKSVPMGLAALTFLSQDAQAVKYRPIKGTVPWHKPAEPSSWVKPDWPVDYFVPNFVRPMPEAEEDLELEMEAELDEDLAASNERVGEVRDISQDAIFLIPGMLPEPYWDFNMVTDKFTHAQMKTYLNRAC